MATEQYKLKPEAFAEIKRRNLIAIVPVIIAMLIPFSIPYVIHPEANPVPQNLPTVLVLMAIFLPILTFRSLQKQKKAYDNFLLTIEDDAIIVNSSIAGEINLSYLEIVEIKKNPDGSFAVRGGVKNTIVLIPAQIEHRERLEERLNRISPVIPKAPSFIPEKYQLILTYIFIAFFFTFLVSGNKIIVAVTGPLACSALVWFFLKLHKNKSLPLNLKRLKWILLLITMSFIYKIVFVLTNHS